MMACVLLGQVGAVFFSLDFFLGSMSYPYFHISIGNLWRFNEGLGSCLLMAFSPPLLVNLHHLFIQLSLYVRYE